MYYLKKFENHNGYQSYITGEGVLLPNVSYCANEVHVHYNPETRLVAIFDVKDDNPTLLYQFAEPGALRYEKIEIDGVEVSIQDIDGDNGYYDLSQGQHTVKYTLKSSTNIGDAAFAECFNIVNIIIPNNITSIGNETFGNCLGLTSVTIGDGLISIGDGAFVKCQNLTNVTIGNSVTTIGGGAFQSCSSLTSVTIPNSVTSIGNYAFDGCSKLTSVTIPDSVTSINRGAFYDCDGLTSVTVNATTPPTLDSEAFDNTNDCPIYVPSGSVDAYKAATNWTTYSSRIQAIPTT